ncbi:MAG: type-F conjugative transfer system secretin TraK, partial [Microbacteriaceae bacterium]|nr:type-F conjugative transfer system secretin TraK [Microbacteriaceae bacterium]
GLLLQPVDRPSDTIIIRKGADTPARTASTASASRHVRSLKNLLLALATESPNDDMDARESAVELQFRPGQRMTRLRTQVGAHAVGEHYVVSNQTSAELRLEPRDFDKPGVMAVSLEHPDLAPGTATSVFVIRERRSHE